MLRAIGSSDGCNLRWFRGHSAALPHPEGRSGMLVSIVPMEPPAIDPGTRAGVSLVPTGTGLSTDAAS